MPGSYFEEYQLGQIIEHPIRRSVTEMDNVLFSAMTYNPQPLHIDFDYAAKSEWGRPLVNSLFTLSLMIGISVHETTLGTIVANLGMTDIRFSVPVFHGDTIRVSSEVVGTRESRSRPEAGIVEFLHRAYKQTGEEVAQCRRQVMVQRRPRAAAPSPVLEA